MSDHRTVRADARANRERIVDAARSLYAEEGGDVSFNAVAHRAGVGNATLYRHFATQEELRDAVYLARIRESTEALAQAAELDDPSAGLRRYLLWVFDTGDLSLFGAAVSGVPVSADVEAAAEGMRDLLDRLVDRAHRLGALRPEIDTYDVLVAAAAMIRIARHEQVSDEHAARFRDVVLRGLGLGG